MTISDKGECRILGGILQANMSWSAHLESGLKALLPRVRRQLGALQSLGRKIPVRCRKTLAHGFILSKLLYLIPVWGATTANQLRGAQVLLNKSARWVTGKARRTRVDELMESAGWLKINEMNLLHSCLLMWKTVHLQKPEHLYGRLTISEDLKLRTKRTRLQFTEKGWRWKTSEVWNTIPDEIRTEKKSPFLRKE